MTRLSTRLSTWYVATLVLLLGTAFGISWIVVASLLQQQVDDDLTEDIEFFRQTYDEGGLAALNHAIADELAQETGNDEFIHLVDTAAYDTGPPDDTDPWKQLVASLDLPGIPPGEDHVLQDLSLPAYAGAAESGDPDPRFRTIVARLDAGLLLHAGESVVEQEQVLSLLATCFVAVLLLGLPVAGVAGWLMARRASRDIEQISAIASRIGNDNFDERIEFQPVDLETANLASTFNHMLDRIHDLVREIRDLTDNIAHDLKGPLARIRFMSEVILSRDHSFAERERYAEQTIEECDRLIHMIDTSLDVAEVEAGIHRNDWRPLDLSVLLADAVDLFEPAAAERQLTLDAEIEPDVRVVGSEHDLQRMVANLLDNAIKYTDTPGRIITELRSGPQSAVLSVTDNGIGIDSRDQQSIFRRFYRCDRSRSKEGCGLGLAFARAVARQMGGDITLTSVPQQGSTFVVTLPRWIAARPDPGPAFNPLTSQGTVIASSPQASMESR